MGQGVSEILLLLCQGCALTHSLQLCVFSEYSTLETFLNGED